MQATPAAEYSRFSRRKKTHFLPSHAFSASTQVVSLGFWVFHIYDVHDALVPLKVLEESYTMLRELATLAGGSQDGI